MVDSPAYVPPKVWSWNKPNGGRFASINRPIAGPTHEKNVGSHFGVRIPIERNQGLIFGDLN
jgi:hypothetical protein